MNQLDEIVYDIELHSVGGIRRHFEAGISPNVHYKGKPLFDTLISMYTRGPRFSDCVQCFVDHGLIFEDKAVLSVLRDDAKELERLIKADPTTVSKQYSLSNAFTPFDKVTLLHICAEFNHLSCARVLIANGADINAKAGYDEDGFGGQTPIFHTVNQNQNNSGEIMDYLLSMPIDLTTIVKGLVWGKGQDWETLIPAVNPISYAMMGMLPQMHRREVVVAEVVSRLIKHAYGIDYTPRNVPCKYLQ
ncbi:MAG: ankyrin repeat domain-containing protein [Chitinophagaceae bacterium]|nr:ankyrin repeat domain-containing protein [Chitinophagaceae bacterium]